MPAGFSTIEPLAATHELEGFDSGAPSLDHWLKTWACHSHKLGSAKTFVVCLENTRRVVGFHALAAASASKDVVPRRVAAGLSPRHEVSLVLLARLAVDKRYQGRKLGKALLRDAMVRTLVAADQIGVVAMVVQAKDDEAYRFYEHFGFLPSPLKPGQMFIPLGTIRRAVSEGADPPAF